MNKNQYILLSFNVLQNLFVFLAEYFANFAVTKRSAEIFFFYLLILFSFLFNVNSYGQEEKISDIISSVAEELADDESDPEAVAVYIEKLHDLNEDPVIINSADGPELSRLFFLTDFQVKSLEDYIHYSGNILSHYEIANIPGFDRGLATMMLPFISLNAGKESNSESIRLRNNLLTNISVKLPPSGATMPGSPWKTLTRYKFTAGRFSGGFTAEKDAGEKLFPRHAPITDFFSANLAWTGKGMVRKIIAGDYGARFGLGTGINTGMSTGLSLTQSGYLSGGDEIKSYTSSDENIFFRGLAAHFQAKKTSLTLFCSANRIDATVDTSENGSERFIRTLQKSGLHNTESALIKKDNVKEYCYGINISSGFSNLRLGLLWTGGRFSIPVKSDLTEPQNIYDFEGATYNSLTAYYRATAGRMVLYGEASASINRRFAFIQGFSFRPADRLTINLLYRDYDPGFKSFHGKGVFSSSSGDNLTGIFGNFTLEAAKYLFVSAGCDLRYYPWLKYRCTAPSMAISREIRIKYLPDEKITFETLYNYRLLMLDNQESYGIEKQSAVESRTLKGTVKYSPEENLTLGIRLDYKIVSPGSVRGMLLSQDISYRFRKIPVSVWLRYCIFNTDNWDSRLYIYENDLIYSFSIPALSGKGSRSYILLSWKSGKMVELRIKYGLTEIIQDINAGKETWELKGQIRMWF